MRSIVVVLGLLVQLIVVVTADPIDVLYSCGNCDDAFITYLYTNEYFKSHYIPTLNFIRPTGGNWYFHNWNLSLPLSANLATLREKQNSIPNLKVTLLDGQFMPALYPAATTDPDRWYYTRSPVVLINPIPKNLIIIDFRQEEASYLAGMLAGYASRTRRVGCIGGRAVPSVKKWILGFQQGVRRVCSACIVDTTFGSSFGSPSQGVLLARYFIARGADVLFNVAGAMGGSGTLYGAARGIMAVGVDFEERKTYYNGTSANITSMLLTTAEARGDVGLLYALKTVQESTFSGGTLLVLDTSFDAVGITYCQDACNKIASPDAWTVINATSAQFRKKSLTLPIVGFTGELSMSARTAFHSRSFIDSSASQEELFTDYVEAAAVAMWRVVIVDSLIGSRVRVYNIDTESIHNVVNLSVASGAYQSLVDFVAVTNYDPVSTSIWVHLVGGRGIPASGLGGGVSDVHHYYYFPSHFWTFEAQLRTASAPASLQRVQHSAVAHPTLPLAYVLGGRDATARQRSDLILFNMTSRSVTSLADAPALIEDHSAVMFQSREGFVGYGSTDMWMVVLGGQNQVAVNGPIGLWYNVRLNRWWTFSSNRGSGAVFPPSVLKPCLTVTNDQVLLVGGLPTGGESSQATWVLSPTTMTWTRDDRDTRSYSFSGQVSCTMYASTDNLTLTDDKVPSAFQDHSVIHRTVILPRAANSTNQIQLVATPNIVCDWTSGLIISPAGDHCIRCPSGRANRVECVAAPVNRDGDIAGGIIGGLVALGLIVGAVVYRLRQTNTKNVANAPKEGAPAFGIVFTDIQNAAQLWARCPLEMGEAVGLYQSTVRRAVHVHKGYEVKVIGDAFMIAFDDPRNAIAFCVDVQSQLQYAAYRSRVVDDIYRRIIEESQVTSQPAGPWNGLRVRVGGHWGRGDVKADSASSGGGYDYYGPVVELAARIEATGHGGQVLISKDLNDASVRAHGADAEQFGEVVVFEGQLLRNVQEPITLIQVLPATLCMRQFPALRTENNETSRSSVDGDDADTVAELTKRPTGATALAPGAAIVGVSLVERLAARVQCNVHPTFLDHPSLFLLEYTTSVVETMFSTCDPQFRRDTLAALHGRWHILEPGKQGSEQETTLIFCSKLLTTIAAQARSSSKAGFFSSGAWAGGSVGANGGATAASLNGSANGGSSPPAPGTRRTKSGRGAAAAAAFAPPPQPMDQEPEPSQSQQLRFV